MLDTLTKRKMTLVKTNTESDVRSYVYCLLLISAEVIEHDPEDKHWLHHVAMFAIHLGNLELLPLSSTHMFSLKKKIGKGHFSLL